MSSAISEEIANIDKLQQAIKEYSSTVTRLNSRQRLTNYHKHFMKKLKCKTQNLKEVQISKVNHLIPPGIGTIHSFNLYDFLQQKSKLEAFHLPIIDSLIFAKDGNPILLCNSRSGHIIQTGDQQATKAFFSKISKGGDQVPVCVFKPARGKSVFFKSLKNLTNYIKDFPKLEGIFQRFVIPSSKKCCILRIHWRSKFKIAGYIIGFDQENKKIETFIKSNNTEKRNSSIHEASNHSLLQYAQEVIKNTSFLEVRRESGLSNDSFNFMNQTLMEFNDIKSSPYRKIEKNDESQIIEKSKKLLTMDDYSCERFIIRDGNAKSHTVTKLRFISPQVVAVSNFVVELLSMRFKHKPLLEITLDFLKDSDGSWLLEKCDKILINEDKSNYKEISLPIETSTLKDYRPRSFANISTNKSYVKIQENLSLIPLSSESPLVLSKYAKSTSEVFNIKKSAGDSMNKVKAKFLSVMNKLDCIAKFKAPKVPAQVPELIKHYTDNYSMQLLNEKKEPLIKINNEEPVEIEEEKPGNYYDSVVKKFHSIRIEARRQNLINKYPVIEKYGGDATWKKIISKLYLSLIESSVLKQHFCHMTKNEYRHKSAGLANLVNSTTTRRFKNQVKQIHASLGITAKEFQEFSCIFSKILLEMNFSHSDLEVIQDNFNSFKPLIIAKYR